MVLIRKRQSDSDLKVCVCRRFARAKSTSPQQDETLLAYSEPCLHPSWLRFLCRLWGIVFAKMFVIATKNSTVNFYTKTLILYAEISQKSSQNLSRITRTFFRKEL